MSNNSSHLKLSRLSPSLGRDDTSYPLQVDASAFPEGEFHDKNTIIFPNNTQLWWISVTANSWSLDGKTNFGLQGNGMKTDEREFLIKNAPQGALIGWLGDNTTSLNVTDWLCYKTECDASITPDTNCYINDKGYDMKLCWNMNDVVSPDCYGDNTGVVSFKIGIRLLP